MLVHCVVKHSRPPNPGQVILKCQPPICLDYSSAQTDPDKNSRIIFGWICYLYHPHCTTTTFIIFESKQRIDESKKRLDCVKDTHRATRRFSVMAVRSPQSQIGDWNKKCYQISFLILFILWLTVSHCQCYCFGKWWLVSGFGWKRHKKWQLALSELFTYGINHVGRRNPSWMTVSRWLSVIYDCFYKIKETI